MGIVVFLYFRTFVPSIAVILAAFSDLIVTLAVINLMGIKLSTAGIAAFLMIIGYSVDTDILLTTRLVKRTHGTVMSRLMESMKTGMTMSATTIVVVTLALIFTQSETIRQIMTILLVGLMIDVINTWIQNAGIIRIYLERKKN
jgi:preprotein translocase subunit SecF